MKYVFTLLFIFYVSTIYAIPKDSIGIVKKKEIYLLTGNCINSIQWEEISINNTSIQNKINADIYALAQSFKIDSIHFEAVCAEEVSYEVISRTVFFENNIVSIFFKSHLIYPNFKSSTSIRTLNYSLTTGHTIIFQELFKPKKQSAINSIILAEMKIWYADFEMRFDNDELVYIQEQIKHVQFNVENNRIVLYMKATHCAYCTDEDPVIVFDFNEYKKYFEKNGILKNLLKKRQI